MARATSNKQERIDADHDLLQRMTQSLEDMAADVKEMKADFREMNVKLGESQVTIAKIEEGREDRVREHDEMFGAYRTFRWLIYPALLSGPVAALVSSLMTYMLIKGG